MIEKLRGESLQSDMEQSWVMQSRDRSVLEETDGMVQAADNRRRIMGSSIFGGHAPPQRYVPPVAQPTQTYRDNMTSTWGASENRRHILESTVFGGTQSPNINLNSTSPSLGSYSRSGASTSLASTMPIPVAQPFPELNFESAPPLDSFSLSFKPRPIQRASQVHRLDVQPNPQMRQLRDELNRDTEQFSKRLRQIGQV